MKKTAKTSGVPEPSVRRMPDYLNYLRLLKNKGRDYVSAPYIAKDLNLDATQVAKDLAYTKATGKPRVGYNLNALIASIEEFLGLNRTDLAFLVGAGSLGEALIKYEGFGYFGLNIVAAFDTDENKIGQEIHGVKVFHIDKLRELAERLHPVLGIITTPAAPAQQVADLMVGWGIKAIWNFTPCSIKVPEKIILQNTSIYANLAVIMKKVQTLYDNPISKIEDISNTL